MTRIAVALLATVVLVGCASEKDHRRDAVNAYLAHVNAAQHDAQVSWSMANMAYSAVGRGKLTKSQLRTLATAPVTIRLVSARMASITPPAEARRLRARLLLLLDLQTSVAEEVSAFARYVSMVTPLERQLGGDTRRLRRTLQRSHRRALEQVALRVYAERLDVVLARLVRLHPPVSLVPWHREQVARITSFRGGARTAARGLTNKDPALVRRGAAGLAGLAALGAVTVPDRTAILAYNARVRDVNAAATAVTREEARLNRELL